MMFKLALRNCLRNTKRSVITSLSIFIAIVVVLLSMSFLYSTIDSVIENERLYSIGDIRIREEKYSEYEALMPLQFYIKDFDSIKRNLLILPEVSSVEAAIRVAAAFYNNEELKNITIIGADSSSVFFGDKATLNEGIIPNEGKKELLATPRFLIENKLSVGDSITIVLKTAAGGTNAATCRIVGSVSYGNAEYNIPLLIIPESTLAPLIYMKDGTLESHIWLKDGVDLSTAKDKISSILSDKGIEVKSWKEVSNIYPIMPLYDAMMALVISLFFFIASTLVFNTMMMSVLERKREISTMIALGFSRTYIQALFVLEGAIISIFGGVFGAIISKILILIFGKYGIDLTPFGADAVEGWGFPKILYVSLANYRYLQTIAIEVLVSVVAAFLASLRIRKLESAEALREEA